jgi:hypothetical protein
MTLLLGSLWFWLFIGAFIIFELFWIAGKESGVGATFTLLVFGGVFAFYGDPLVFTWIVEHPLELAVGIGLYLVVACVWGFVKWYLFLKNKAREYQEARRNFLVSNGHKDAKFDTGVPDDLRVEWAKRRSFEAVRPVASRHKDVILMWMTYWPVSMLWTLVEDTITHLYNLCAARLERMSERLFGNVGYDDDMKAPDDEEE